MSITLWTATLWEDDIAPVSHVQLGLSRLLAEYQDYTDHPRVHDFLRTFLTQNQNLEDVSWQVFVERWPLTAVGVQLDVLGRLVGQGRGGRTDDQYRLWILARIAVNRSNGKIEELINILEILGPETIEIWESYPAELHISVTGMTDGDQVGELIGEAKAAGVTLHWLWTADSETSLFRFGALGARVQSNIGFTDIGGPPYPAQGGFTMQEAKR
jgi:hypothetical protein